MEGESTQEILLHGVILHELRRQFHEVPPHISTRKGLETSIGEHAVQTVPKLMKESFHLAQRQERGLFLNWVW